MPERSGSPNSLSSWDSIGGQGRLFLGHGPGREEIERLTGRPALEPVRAYVGLSGGAGDVEEQARMAVRELRRAGAFERSAICVATATGSGWVDEWMTQPLEYLTGGDCATVSIQYSYLFSAVMMLSDLQPCLDAGRALFEAVEAEVAGLPEPRPRLFVAGESLGAQGSQAAFESLEDLLARVDGAIWAGSPAQSSLLQEALDSRDHGSPYVAPVVDGGRHVRFFTGLSPAADGGDWSAQPWVAPRVAFMQHPSDPVVFYEPSIAFRRPPWYRETGLMGTPSKLTFLPLVSYLQMLAALSVAGQAPTGFGHTYHRELLEAWVGLLGLQQTELAQREFLNSVAEAIRADLDDYNKGIAAPARGARQDPVGD